MKSIIIEVPANGPDALAVRHDSVGGAADEVGDGWQVGEGMHRGPGLAWLPMAGQLAPDHHLPAGRQAHTEGGPGCNMRSSTFPPQGLRRPQRLSSKLTHILEIKATSAVGKYAALLCVLCLRWCHGKQILANANPHEQCSQQIHVSNALNNLKSSNDPSIVPRSTEMMQDFGSVVYQLVILERAHPKAALQMPTARSDGDGYDDSHHNDGTSIKSMDHQAGTCSKHVHRLRCRCCRSHHTMLLQLIKVSQISSDLRQAA